MLAKLLSALMLILTIWVLPIAANAPCMGGDCSSSSTFAEDAWAQQAAWEASANAFVNSPSDAFGGGMYAGIGSYPYPYSSSSSYPYNSWSSPYGSWSGPGIYGGRTYVGAGSPEDPFAPPVPPSSALAKARELAKLGDPQTIKKYLASSGFRMDDMWCGDFAAAVVIMSGGTPPKDPQLADNWRNWGTVVEGPPQAGDVAVKKHPSGTHGHVTFVDSYNPKTKRFFGLGGNQGGWRSLFREDQYTFRR